MATLASQVVTLLDVAKRLEPNGGVTTQIAEILNQTNELLPDMLWREGNLPTGHRLTMRTGLPSGIWRKFNQGVPSSKSTTVQVDETCGMYEDRGKIDKALATLEGSTADMRMSESVPHMESMNQAMTTAFFYADSSTPEKPLGFSARYSSLSAGNSQNIIDAGGTGTDNCSIWLFGWGPTSVFGIYPKGSKAGLTHTPIQDGTGDGCADALDADGNPFRALVDHFKWDAGWALKDWRYVVRICNIDVSNLVGESSAADIIKLMTKAIFRLPNRNGVRLAFYANRTVHQMLAIQALNKSANAVKVEEAIGQFGEPLQTVKFLGIPVRLVDALLNNESRVT